MLPIKTIAMLALLVLAAPTSTLGQESLVTPELIGRPDAPITLTISPRVGYSHQTNIEARRQVLTEAFESWILRHPNVKIVVQVQQGDDGVIVAKRLQDVPAGRAADAIMTESVDYQTFYALTEPFDPYLSKADIADYFPGITDAARDPATGKLKYLQVTSYTPGLWYRKDLISAPPTSLEELADMAEKVKAEHGFRYGLFVMGGNQSIIWTLLSQTASIGGALMSDDAQLAPIFGEGKNREALIRVLTYYKDLVDRGVMPTDVVNATETGDLVSHVAAGEVPFVIGGSFLDSGISVLPDTDKWAFVSMPELGGASPVNFQGGWSWGLYTKDPEKQALITDLLMDVYAGPWAMARFAEAGGYTLPRRSVLEKYAAFTTEGRPKAFADAVSIARTFPSGRNWNVISAALTTAFQQVVLGAATPDQAVDEAWAQAQRDISSK